MNNRPAWLAMSLVRHEIPEMHQVTYTPPLAVASAVLILL